MPNVPRSSLVLIGAAAIAACARDDSEQNIIIDNNFAADADIEAVPADEGGLGMNGADNAADEMAANNSL